MIELHAHYSHTSVCSYIIIPVHFIVYAYFTVLKASVCKSPCTLNNARSGANTCGYATPRSSTQDFDGVLRATLLRSAAENCGVSHEKLRANVTRSLDLCGVLRIRAELGVYIA